MLNSILYINPGREYVYPSRIFSPSFQTVLANCAYRELPKNIAVTFKDDAEGNVYCSIKNKSNGKTHSYLRVMKRGSDTNAQTIVSLIKKYLYKVT